MKWLLAGLTGLFYILAIAPREYFFLGWVAFLPLLWAHRDVSAKKAFFLAWFAGTLSNLGNYYWVYELMVTHSAMPAVAAVLGTLALALQQGLREGIWLGLSRRFHRDSLPMILTYPTVYVAVEFLYPTIFPLHLSNSQASFAATHQLMDIAGPPGLSWVMMAFQIGLFVSINRKAYSHQAAIAFAVLVLTLVYGNFRIKQYESIMAQAPTLRVGMVENNVGVGRTNLELALRQIKLALELANNEKPDLIVFPETAIKTPPPPHRLQGQTEFQEADTNFYPLNLAELAQDHRFSPQINYRIPIIFGATAIDLDRPGPVPGRPALFNAAFMVDGKGKVLGTALKNRLLVFGEYVPGASLFPSIYSKILTQASALYAGTEPGIIAFNGHTVGITICYEDILPSFSYEILQKKPELLVNLTNDGWFGKTAEPATHLALAQARAIEARLYMVRSTATGISAFIDPLGRNMKVTDIEEPETLVENVAWLPGGSPFVLIGPYFGWLCVFLTLLWVFKERHSQPNLDEIDESQSSARQAR